MRKRFFFAVLLSSLLTGSCYAINVDSLRIVSKQPANDSNKVNALLSLSQAFSGQSSDSMMHFAERAKALSKRIDWKKGTGLAYEKMAISAIISQQYDSALFYCNKAIALYKHLGMTNEYGEAFITKGIAYANSFNIQQASKQYFRARKVLMKSANETGLAKVYANLANLHQKQDQYDSALFYHHKALLINQRKGLQMNLAINYSNIGVIHFSQSNNADALKYFTLSHEIFNKLGIKRNLNILNINMGKVLLALDRFEEAITHYESTKEYFKTEGATWMLATVAIDLGHCNKGLDRIDEGVEQYLKARTLFASLNDTASLINCLNALAGCYSGTEQPDSVQLMYSRALDLAKQSKSRVALANTHAAIGHYLLTAMKSGLPVNTDSWIKKTSAPQLLSLALFGYKESGRLADQLAVLHDLKELHVLLNQPDSALHYADLIIDTELAQHENNDIKKIARFELKLQFDKRALQDSLDFAKRQELKNAQIDFERHRVSQQKVLTIMSTGSSLLVILLAGIVYRSRKKTQQQNGIIQKRNNQIEWLLKEIHHRVKNNLQIVSSLMSIQSRTLHDLGAKRLIRESQNRIKSMGLVHESLYEVDDFSRIELLPFIKRIADNVKTSLEGNHQSIGIEIEGDILVISPQIATPVGIIINELVTNAFKHAFASKEKGVISIKLTLEPNQQVKLLIGDDGEALPKQDDTLMNSVGMALVTSLVEEQLDGSFEWLEGAGEKFCVEFSIDKQA